MAEYQGETKEPVEILFPAKDAQTLKKKAHAWMDNHPDILQTVPSLHGLLIQSIDREKELSLLLSINIEVQNEKLIVFIKNIYLQESMNASNNYKPSVYGITGYESKVDEKIKLLLEGLTDWINK